jgi:F-type H+-transporting ATPase subunit gamma
MAKGTKELKQRITGVKNIQKITRAMEMVATQKLKRLQGRAEAARPYAEKVQQMVARLAGSVSSELSPLLGAREVKRRANLVIASDKGLCGGYNSNLARKALEVLRADAAAEPGVEQRTRALGSKGALLLEARGQELHGHYEDVVEKLDFIRVRNLTRELVAEFLAGETDELRLVYTSFESSARQRATVVTILPIRPESLAGQDEAAAGADFIIEPDAEALLKDLLPKFLEIKVYTAVLESLASEFTARRNAMKQATDAANDMIEALTRQYNRARQESITNELLEVVGGAEALK